MKQKRDQRTPCSARREAVEGAETLASTTAVKEKIDQCRGLPDYLNPGGKRKTPRNRGNRKGMDRQKRTRVESDFAEALQVSLRGLKETIEITSDGTNRPAGQSERNLKHQGVTVNGQTQGTFITPSQKLRRRRKGGKEKKSQA